MNNNGNSSRHNDRAADSLRDITITRNYICHSAGSVLIEFGRTKVICTANIAEKTPSFLKGTGKGWVTAEYGMLPGSTGSRMQREASRGRQTGRTVEIQRLIGRSLRAVTDLHSLGERTVNIDCDVIQADGGTRTAAITGAFVALFDAVTVLMDNGTISSNPIREHIAAVSVGKVAKKVLLDLDYSEDSQAEVDMNLVVTEGGDFVEIQGTGEESVFSRTDLDNLLDMGQKGIAELINMQKSTLGTL